MTDNFEWREPNLRPATPPNGRYWTQGDPRAPMEICAVDLGAGRLEIQVGGQHECFGIVLPAVEVVRLKTWLSTISVEPVDVAGQIEHMVYRFLNWKLPEDFGPDAGISFTPTYNNGTPQGGRHSPSGTNLFNYNQAEAMVRHMLEGLPEADAPLAALARTDAPVAP